MKLIKTIIFFALLSYCILFCVENFQRLSITVPFIANIESVPLFIVIIFSVIAGVLLGNLVGTTRRLKGYFSNSSTRKENKNLKKKIDLYETETKIRNDVQLPVE